MSAEAPQQPQSDLPTWRELLEQVKTNDTLPVIAEKKYAKEVGKEAVAAQTEYAHLQGLRDHYRHKGKWSTFLMFVMAGMILFQCLLLGMVGFGFWDFTKYEWLLPVLLVQNLAQIIGLAVFVVKALFKDMAKP